MKEITIKLSEEECKAFAGVVKDYKETNWNCDASKARLFAEMMKKNLI